MRDGKRYQRCRYSLKIIIMNKMQSVLPLPELAESEDKMSEVYRE